MDLKIFGIRHHGPGSSRHLEKALRDFEPDLILLEGPQELEDLQHYIGTPDLVPPVAALIYNSKEIRQASYYPFTHFSPEWIAMSYANKNKIHLWQFDLPMAIKFAMSEQEEIAMPESAAEKNPEIAEMVRDPLGFMSRLAGYTDSERWWEVTFEQHLESDAAIFDAILLMMTTLRNELDAPEPVETLRREACMRNAIRKAEREMYQRVAVVCGAWHSPALVNWKSFKAKEDNDLLKGFKKISVKATWIPWTYQRIARGSGYGAGVVSPAWYNFLYENPKTAVQQWMIQVARLFREEDLDASSAHVIEAVRLAETLATIRGMILPGIDELQEAAVAIFCGGYEAQMDFISEKLIVGDVIGSVPAEIPTVPLQEDFETQCKKLRMKPEAGEKELELDLREEPAREKSFFLHRLDIISVPWGKKQEGNKNAKTTYSELWKLKWLPDFYLNIIEAASYGNTIETAAETAIRHVASEAESLSATTDLLRMSLDANLLGVIDVLSEKLRELASITKDVQQLMKALPSLVRLYKYGDVRGTDKISVKQILNQLIPRVAVGLVPACSSLSEEAGEEMFKHFLETHRAIGTYNQEEITEIWKNTLVRLPDNELVFPKIRGGSLRLLFDQRQLEIDDVASKMKYALSRAVAPAQCALWLEGFLHGSALLLIHQPELWQVIDDWVNQIEKEPFVEILPLLRRTFSNFPQPERKKIFELAKTDQIKVVQNQQIQDEFDAQKVEKLNRSLSFILLE